MCVLFYINCVWADVPDFSVFQLRSVLKWYLPMTEFASPEMTNCWNISFKGYFEVHSCVRF